jgi:flavin-dependent dehydrogenase
MAVYKDIKITQEFLDNNPDAYFVFGDNLERWGYGGAAKLRDHPHAIGFITKKFPDNKDNSFYKPEEYSSVFFEELEKLKRIIEKRPDKIFYISQLGGGLANRYYIWQKLIRHNLVRILEKFKNVIFCWDDSFK